MFRAVLGHSGRAIDFDRALVLMDKELLAESMKAMQEEKKIRPYRDPIPPDSPLAVYNGPCDESDWTQWVWSDYCERHFEKYAEFFAPDVNPDWDR